MKIENLKKSKIFYIIIFIVAIVFGVKYYFAYYKNSPTYMVDTFFDSFKYGTQGHRNVEEIYDMVYFKIHSPKLDDATKRGYQWWTIKNFHILNKQKLDNDIYQFCINMDENYDGRDDFFRNSTFDCWTIKQNNKWFIVLGVHNVPDDILQRHEELQKMLEEEKKDDNILLPDEFVLGG